MAGLLDFIFGGGNNNGLLPSPQAQRPSAQQIDPLNSALYGFINPGAPFQLQQQYQGAQAAGQAGGLSPAQTQALQMNPEALKTIWAQQNVQNHPTVVPFGSTVINPAGKELFNNQSGEMLLDQPTLAAMAEQYRSGDTTVMQNLGRGAQGAENIVKLRKEITRQNAEAKTSGASQAMTNAEFFGVKSGQRTLGNKQANIDLAATEFQQVLPIVLEASNAVNRTTYPDLNKVIQAFEEKTGDPNVVKFGSGVNTLVNLYARAISPTGAATVSDKDHARVLLNRAWSTGQFQAATDMMVQEIKAALASPEKVREEQRRRFLGGQSGAKPTTETAPAKTDPLGIR